MRPFLTALITLAFLFPIVGATATAETDADPGLFLFHDLTQNATAWVGQPHTFGYVLLDGEGMTQVHKQGCIVVEQNGVVLYETTADSSHDYNALNTFTFTFERAGPFTVWVAIPDGECDETILFEDEILGVAKRPAEPTRVAIAKIQGPEQPPAETLAARIGIGAFYAPAHDTADGTRWDNTTGFLEIRRPGDEWLALRVPLEDSTGGEEEMSICYRFPHPGPWLLRAVVEDRTEPARFAPVATTRIIEVTTMPAGAVTTPEDYCPATQRGCVAPDVNTAADSERFRLRTTIDPQASSSPFSRFVLNALVYDADAGRPAANATYSAMVQSMAQDCNQFLLATRTLTGDAGVADLVMHWPDPGQYAFQVEAAKGDWADRTTLLFTVGEVLPIHGIPMPGTAGAVIVTADGLSDFVAGESGTVTFFSADPTGRAAAHSEIDFQILREEWGTPLVQNKLHTHGSGSFDFTYTFAEPGDYLLVVDPVTIHGEATPDYYYGSLGGELVVPFTVAEGPGLEDNTTEDEDDRELEGDSTIPGAGVLFLVIASAIGLAIRRRSD